MYLESGNPKFEDCRIINNRASTTNQNGGGVYSNGSNLTITGGELVQNIASRGGALAFFNGAAKIVNCTFLLNVTSDRGGAIYALSATIIANNINFTSNTATSNAGAIFVDNQTTASQLVLTDCHFLSNKSLDGVAGAISMGGIGSIFEANECTFQGNSSQSDCGAIKVTQAATTLRGCTFSSNGSQTAVGAVGFINAASTLIEDCTFDNNVAAWSAGALALGGPSVVERCTFYNNRAGDSSGAIGAEAPGNHVIRNSLFRANHANNASLGGGAISNATNGLQVTNCTFVENVAANGSAIRNSLFQSSTLCNNSILWNNVGSNFEGSGSSTVNYSSVQGGWNGPGTGNIATDPMFTAPLAGDYTLSSSSPCIDAADNSALPPGTKSDLLGNIRFRDDPMTDDTGFGYPPMVDIGCYEFQPIPNPCPWDCAQPPNGIVNVIDLLMVINSWGLTGGPADLNGDSLVNVLDLLAIIEHWGPCP